MKWIWKNKEWLFSGVGVAVIIAAIKFVSFDWLAAHWQEILLIGGGIVIGGFAIYGFIRLSQDLLSKVQARPPTTVTVAEPPIQEVSNAPRRFVDITPDVIIDDIHSAKPLRRGIIAKTYHGQWVKWRTRLGHAWTYDETDPGNVYLTLCMLDSRSGDTVCKVKAADYPELMNMGKGDRIDVVGRIDEASASYVTLGDAVLSFPPPEHEEAANAAPAPAALLEALAGHPKLSKEQIKILKTLALYEDFVQNTVPMAELQKQCDLTTTQLKYHAEELRKANLIFVTYLPDGPHYQNSPAGAGWLINTKQKY